MGTLFGFSGRMRYDLVVNTFVKDAMMKGEITLHHGGQMWRPLIEVRDAAQAYIAVLEAPERLVASQVFNLVHENCRISEVALRVGGALRDAEIPVNIKSDDRPAAIRNYRVSGKKITELLSFRPKISIEESVKNMINSIRANNYINFDHDRYYNIRWLRLLEEIKSTIDVTGTLFDAPVIGQGISSPWCNPRKFGDACCDVRDGEIADSDFHESKNTQESDPPRKVVPKATGKNRFKKASTAPF